MHFKKMNKAFFLCKTLWKENPYSHSCRNYCSVSGTLLTNNHGQNILQCFDVLPNFSFNVSET